MLLCCMKNSTSYLDPKNSEEKEIRRWEADIGSFQIDFNQIYQRIMHDRNVLNPKQVQKAASEEFSNNFTEFFNQTDYFNQLTNGKTYLNSVKVSYLFFLLTSQGIINNRSMNYPDKAYFLYLRSKDREEDDLSQGMDKHNERLRNVVRNLVEIACVVEPQVFMKARGVNREGTFKEIANNLDETVDHVIDDLFTLNKKSVDALSFKDLKDRFNSDNYFFSSGYMRVKAIEVLDLRSKNRLMTTERN